ncbi:MAG: hypothetical protein R3C10_02285 [Pirellulales bacterium]
MKHRTKTAAAFSAFLAIWVVSLGLVDPATKIVVAADPATSDGDSRELVRNGSFADWTDGAPDHWEVSVGAKNGADEPTSKVARIKGPALMLRGDAKTMAWHAVSQELPVVAGGSYLIEYESRTKDVHREGTQYDNCYVGVASSDKQRKIIAQGFDDVAADTDGWAKHSIAFDVPSSAAATKIVIFLSKSGILAVRNVSATAPKTDTPSTDSVLLANGDFKSWSDGRPDGWQVTMGANNGADAPTSDVGQLDDAGLVLGGNASTMAWYAVIQPLDVRQDKSYTMTFEVQTDGVRQQGSQFDNCYVGVFQLDAAGKPLDVAAEDVSDVPRWKTQRIDFRVPQGVAKTEARIFLSKSGTLRVKNVRVEEAAPRRPFRRTR